MEVSPFYIVLGILAITTIAYFLFRNPDVSRKDEFQISDLEVGPIRHQQLSDTLDSRIRNIEEILSEVYPISHEEWVDGFKRDLDPEREIAIYEAIALAYKLYNEKHSLSLDAKYEVFGLLLIRSSKNEEGTLAGATLRFLDRAEAKKLLQLYTAPPQPIIYYQK